MYSLLIAALLAADPVPPFPPSGLAPRIVELTPNVPSQSPLTPTPGAPLSITALHYRWWTIKDYTGPVTWENDNESVVSIKEVLEATTLLGLAEGAAEDDFYKLPVGAVVAKGRGVEGIAKLSAFGVVGGRAKRLDTIVLQVGKPPLPPPDPSDPLSLSLRTLMKAGDLPNIAKLAAVYEAVNPDDRAFMTVGDLQNYARTLGNKEVPRPALQAIRDRIEADSVAALGNDSNAVLTDASRARIKSQFARIAKVLRGLN